MTEQPTDPTAVRDVVMACAWKATQAWHAHLNNECEDHFGRPCPATRAADERTQQAVEWAMARAACDAHIRMCNNGGFGRHPHCDRKYEADAAEKWSKLNE